VIGYLLSGLLIGALGRLAIPGRQQMGCIVTTLVGIVGSVLAGLVGDALFDNYTGSLLLAVLCSAGIVLLISRVSR
jgi:uncharacterized membrane protein YeaQ/YmgE (transglycosylase-associated protein family)